MRGQPIEHRNGYLERTRGTILRVYSRSSDFFDDLIKDIQNSEDRVYILNYIISDYYEDDISRKLVDLLAEKRRENVDVKARFDITGVIGKSGLSSLERLRETGVELQLNNVVSLKRLMEGKPMIAGEHRKIFIVDDVAYIGGVCVNDRWYDNIQRDVMVKVKGDVVKALIKNFMVTFPSKKFVSYRNSSGGETPISVVFSSEGDKTFKKELIKLIDEAKDSIYIENQYFIDRDVCEALVKACERGVKVVVVLPGKGDDFLHQNVYIPASKYLTDRLLRAGAEVWRYKEGLLHSKIAVIDNRHVIVGSHNLDYIGLEHNYETSLIIDSEEVAEKFKSHIEETIKMSVPERRDTTLISEFLLEAIEHSPFGRVKGYQEGR